MVLAADLLGCATELRYRPATMSDSYGYRDKVAGPGEYSITFTGEAGMPPRRVAELALLRAAQLTRAAGRTHFVVLHQVDASRPGESLHTLAIVSGGAPLTLPVGVSREAAPICVLLIRTQPIDAPPAADALEAKGLIDGLLSEVQPR
jgi:hypothetical protein